MTRVYASDYIANTLTHIHRRTPMIRALHSPLHGMSGPVCVCQCVCVCVCVDREATGFM